MLPIQRTPLQNKKKNMAMAKSRRRSAQIVTKNSSVILRGFLKVKMACCSIIVTIASSVTIASMISTQCEISSRNRPPPISEHLDLTFWVVAYERFDCISFFLFTFFYSFRWAMAFGITIVIYQSGAVWKSGRKRTWSWEQRLWSPRGKPIHSKVVMANHPC